MVVSETAYVIMTLYFESIDSETFILSLQNRLELSKEQAQTYLFELNDFLTSANSHMPSVSPDAISPKIPIAVFSKDYMFNEKTIRIHFDSEKLLKLIHPFLQHASVEHNNSSPDAIFDIFKSDGKLYLFKNTSIIDSFDIDKLHLLQGKFSIELTSSIYDNSEADWMATFHASTICNDKEAVMLIGDSGNGKSTLSAVLMAHGFDLLADDFTPMLAKNQHLYRFPAAISIKSGAFSMLENLFPDFKRYSLEKSNSKPINVKYLPPNSQFETGKKHFKCEKIVLVKYEIDHSPSFKECSSEKILQTLIPDSWISPHIEHSKLFLEWLKDLKFYELTYNTNAFAISKFQELFDN